MNCTKVQERLAEYLGDELAASDREAFETHVSGCSPCRREVESLQGTLRVLRELPPPADATPAEVTRGRRSERRPVRFGMPRPLAYAAMLLVGVGIGWVARSADTVRPDSPIDRPPQQVVKPAPPRDPAERLQKSPFLRNAVAFTAAMTRGS